MRKVGFISEENDHRLPIYPDSIKEYGRKKIKIYATKSIFSNMNILKTQENDLNIVSEKELLNSDILCSVNPVDESLLRKIAKPTKLFTERYMNIKKYGFIRIFWKPIS